jgi:phage terminase Nu1 subunit (DNA packaging protein)
VRKRRGELLDADTVARQWSDVLRRVRAGVMAVPSRVRAQLPRLTAQDIEVIDRELRDALTVLAD